MKILMLNYEFPPIGGGAANANLSLLKQYTGKSDLQIDVLTSAPAPGLSNEHFADNINIYKVGIHKKHLHFWRRSEVVEWLVKAGPHYRKLVRENDYNLAHAFFGFPTGWLCYRNADELPYIISLRGSDVPGDNARLQLDYKILGPVFRKIWKKAARLVACSEGLKQRALKFLPSVKIDVIPNGVELEKFFPAKNKQPTEELGLVTTGRLSPTKRIDVLIDTVEILRNKGYKVRFVVVGAGVLEQQLKQMISQKKLDSCIEMTGRVEREKMPDLYRDSDIYISASMTEGMSNSMLEALASGLPIVTTRCEGLDELINNNGVIIENPVPEEISKAIMNLADHRQTLTHFSAVARERAEKFSWRSVADKYRLLYEDVCRKK
jgi:glycosyltransferase involved in cell wall biosynthesis